MFRHVTNLYLLYFADNWEWPWVEIDLNFLLEYTYYQNFICGRFFTIYVTIQY